MPIADLREYSDLDRAIENVLATPAARGVTALRSVFVDRLDFGWDGSARAVPLHHADLPPSADVIAERDGVDVVLVRFPAGVRLNGKNLTTALTEIGRTLADVFLVAADSAGTEWQFVYPTQRGGRAVLRRMVVVKGQPRRTVVEQLAGIYKDTERVGVRRAIDNAYDVEAVTKKFFAEYRRVFEQVMALVRGLPGDEERRLFCQTLMNRLMFLYFLQRKGWLVYDGDSDYLNALWRGYEATSPPERDGDFYTSRLRFLFFTALNNERSADFSVARDAAKPLIGDPPFLNGGLFAETELDKRPDVTVPDEAIRLILRDLFARYNFTIAESTPYDIEVAVDPEMLGKVFEELVTGRHETGSYYTPRPVVSFMCREALKGYLAARVEGLTPEAVGRFVDDHDVSSIPFTLAGKVLAALEAVTVVDPACGSGAYLLGMLHELVELQRLLWNSNLIAGAKELYELKLNVIERNVYGVDIDRFAVNIAMLRLWLSLVVDYDGPADKLPPLPNLDYKIARGDSLTAPDPKSFQQLALAHELIVAYRDAKGAYLHAHGEEKRMLRDRIDRLRHDIAAMPRAGGTAIAGAFDWAVEFAEVFEHGGFDVVLANPPYVRADAQFKHLQNNECARQAAIAEWKEYRAVLLKSNIYQTLYEKWDLYIPFLERAHQLLRSHGQMIFIISDAYNAAKYARKSHEFFLSNALVERIDFCSDIPLFKAGISNTILHFGKAKPTKANIPSRVRRWGDKPDDFSVNVEFLANAPQVEFGVVLFRINGMQQAKALDSVIELGKLCYISYGLRANADDHDWQGEFTTKDCVSPTKDGIHSKPFVQGKDLVKWWAWRIWYLEWGTPRAPDKFSRPTFPELHEADEKLIAARTPSATPRAIYDRDHLHFDASSVGFVPWHHLQGVRNKSIRKTAKYQDEINQDEAPPEIFREELERQSQLVNLKYILAVMNSAFVRDWLATRRRSKVHIYPDDWKLVPIVNVAEEQQLRLTRLVDGILVEFAQHGYPLPLDAAERVSELERQIDARVARLYGLTEADVAAMEGTQRGTTGGKDEAVTA